MRHSHKNHPIYKGEKPIFEATLKPQPDFESKLYDIIYQIAKKVADDRKKEVGIPIMLSKSGIAKWLFNNEISAQSLDVHILQRPDFPKVHIGTRVFYPCEDVLQWFREHKEVASRHTPKLALLGMNGNR